MKMQRERDPRHALKTCDECGRTRGWEVCGDNADGKNRDSKEHCGALYYTHCV
jgi:hypothetical protein